MTREINTIEIAKLYETQGYYEDACQIYLKLDQENSSTITRAGISRMQMRIDINSVSRGSAGDFGSEPEKRIARLFEKWINLIVLKHRLDRFKRFKSRLI